VWEVLKTNKERILTYLLFVTVPPFPPTNPVIMATCLSYLSLSSLYVSDCKLLCHSGDRKKTLSLFGLLVPLFEVEGKILPPGYPVVGVLDEPYSAKLAHRSSHTGPPGYIGWTLDSRHGSSLCRLAGLNSYSAERGYVTLKVLTDHSN
jgi:hypothetical protein